MKVLHGVEGQNRDRSGVLRILILEGGSLDAELLGVRLSEGGIRCERVRVQSRDAFASALEVGRVDLILADYAPPGFDGLSALRLAKELRPGVPVLAFQAGSDPHGRADACYGRLVGHEGGQAKIPRD